MTKTSPESAKTSGTLPSTTNASKTASLEELTTRPVIKRARPQLSCVPCRQGKLKCNRMHPVCDQCEKRAKRASCSYVPPPTRQKQTQNMKGRIRNLESLVVTLMNSKTGPDVPLENGRESTTDQPATQPSLDGNTNGLLHHEVETGDPNPTSFGQLRISQTDTAEAASYVGAAHWSAILKEIAEVRNYLDENDEADDAVEDGYETVSERATLTFGSPKPVSKASLLAELPPKEEVDRLLPFWFNSSDPLLFMLHTPTFRAEYSRFWADPTNTPIMWIALLYNAMALAIILGPRSSEFEAYYSAHYDKGASTAFLSNAAPSNGGSTHDLVSKYQGLAASAMALGDIAKPQPYVVEAALAYGECEFLKDTNYHVRIWFLLGVLIRVALRMGYHRDPKHFKNMTPYQGEMRRRCWHILYQMDVLVSFAVGLPSMLRRIESDTRHPHNLYDTDFSADCTELPTERSSSEITPGSYFIAKSRICAVFAEAAELWQSVIPPCHSDIMAVDDRLQSAYAAIPEGLRVRSMGESIADSPIIIMSRFNIDLLYLKTRSILHRKYITAGRYEPEFATSRMICVSSAMAALRHHSIIFNACLPGGQLHKVWWFMGSLATYDFLLAAMIVALELEHIRTAEASPTFKGSPSTITAEMVGLLEMTYAIWANHPKRIAESRRACAILREMLKKVGSNHQILTNHTVRDGINGGHQSAPQANFLTNIKELDMTTAPEIDLSSFDMPDLPGDIDWDIWDNAVNDFHPGSVPDQAWPFDLGSNMIDPLYSDPTANMMHEQYFDPLN